MQTIVMPTIADVRAAAARLSGIARRTRVVRFDALSDAIGGHIFLKCEHEQVGGAFKFRGATNVIAGLDAAALAHGIVCHSSGNHGIAVALAARARGTTAIVVVPRTVSPAKLAGIRAAGADVRFCEPTVAARESAVAEIVAATGATLVHPYDDPRVIAGQGTCALELIEDVPGLDAIVAPISGGGLMSGVAIAARGVAPSIELVGCEPELAADAAASIRDGQLHGALSTSAKTSADGLRASLSERTFRILRDHVRDVVTVSEAEIVDAMAFTREAIGLTIEPSSAVAIAAVRKQGDRWRGRRVGVIVTGGNVPAEAAT